MIQEATAGLYLTSPSGETFTNPFFLLATCIPAKPSTAAAEPLAGAPGPAEMWISPDAARQFHSPYSYCPNPINCFDPDGNAGIILGGGASTTIQGKGNYQLSTSLVVTHDPKMSLFNPKSWSMAWQATNTLPGTGEQAGLHTGFGFFAGATNASYPSELEGAGTTSGFSVGWLKSGFNAEFSQSYTDFTFTEPTRNTSGKPVIAVTAGYDLPGPTVGAEVHKGVKTNTVPVVTSETRK